jgi:hypothetical protein
MKNKMKGAEIINIKHGNKKQNKNKQKIKTTRAKRRER